jgi:preprotein translocase SecE subunit
MAVAFKNPPVVAGSSPFDRMPVVSLVGAAYVLGSLAIALWAVPALWNLAGATPALQSVFDYWGPGSQLVICLLVLTAAAAIGFVAFRVPLRALSEKRDGPASLEYRALRNLQLWLTFASVMVGLAGLLQIAGGDVLLLGAEVGVVVVLAYLGYRLLGPHPAAGTRAGIFVGLAGLILALLLSRWLSLWLEHWIFVGHGLGDSPTIGLVISSAVCLALVGGLIYLFMRPEAEKYLTLVDGQGWFSGSSYKGLQGQRVRRGTILGILLIAGSGVWTMWNNGLLHRLPQNWALNIPFTGTAAVDDPADAVAVLKDLPAQVKDQVKIVAAGGSALKPGAVVSQQVYRDALKSRIRDAADLSQPTKDRLEKEVTDRDITEIVNPSGLVNDGAPAGLPAAALLVDQYTLRDANDRLKRDYVRVADPGLSHLTKNKIVSKEEFNKVAADPNLAGVGGQPVAAAPFAASGPIAYRSLTLLPSVQFLLPALLLLGSMWLAWRVVNFPPFADFLIATEAELNKVSWTTRSRLIQDTIVVLATVFLMAMFLFLMDQTWRVVLSWKPIGVLQIGDDQSDKNKSAEQKPW